MDALVQDVPHSLKCYVNPAHTVSIPRQTLGPEVTYATQHRTGMVLVVYNLWWHEERVLQFPNAAAVPNSVTVRYGTAHRRRTKAEMEQLRQREGYD